MVEFPTKISGFRELLTSAFEDFLKKIPLFLVSLLLISLIELLLLFLINPQLLKVFPTEFLKTNPLLLLLAGILVFFFSVWKFLTVFIIKEEVGLPPFQKLGSFLIKGLSVTLRIFLPLILSGGIIAGFLILAPKLTVFLIIFLVYFLALFASYISLEEKRGGLEAFIRGFHVLQRNIFRFYWKIIIFFIVLILAFFVLGTVFALFYFQVLPLPAVLNLILAAISGLVIYFLFWMIACSYLSVLFKNTWEIRKYIAFYRLSPLLIMAIYVFLVVILATLILGIGVT